MEEGGGRAVWRNALVTRPFVRTWCLRVPGGAKSGAHLLRKCWGIGRRTSQRGSDADLSRGSRALVTAAALRDPYFNQRYQKCRSMSIISMRVVATGWWAMKPGGGERRETSLMLFSQLVWDTVKSHILFWGGWGGGVFNNKRWRINIPSPASLQELFHKLINGATLYLLTAVRGKMKFLLDFNQFFGDRVY